MGIIIIYSWEGMHRTYVVAGISDETLMTLLTCSFSKETPAGLLMMLETPQLLWLTQKWQVCGSTVFCKHPPDFISPRNSLGLGQEVSPNSVLPQPEIKQFKKQNIFDTMSCFNIFYKVCLRETEIFNEEGVTDYSCTVRHIMEQAQGISVSYQNQFLLEFTCKARTVGGSGEHRVQFLVLAQSPDKLCGVMLDMYILWNSFLYL